MPASGTGRRLATVSLASRHHALASPACQNAKLCSLEVIPSFSEAMLNACGRPLTRGAVEVLQLNLGKRCNQTCRHCHVDAGPDRTEVMSDDVIEASLKFIERYQIRTVDITGGAPETHPRFREIVERARTVNATVIDRCNLTILALPNYRDLPDFFARNRVEIIASLPWYRADETDAQRGQGVHASSIDALRRLNRVGYGDERTALLLNLVTNPVGAYLCAPQPELERRWKLELEKRHGVRFNRLYTITNMPIGRFFEFLEDTSQLTAYMQKLVQAFNPQTVDGLMCRTTLSVGWDGRLYDCDFNQMLEMDCGATIFTVRADDLIGSDVRVGRHCFGCTAGKGSSCGGAIA